MFYVIFCLVLLVLVVLFYKLIQEIEMDVKYVQLFQAIQDQKQSIIDNLMKINEQIMAVIRENSDLPTNRIAESHRNISLQMVMILEKYIEINYSLELLLKVDQNADDATTVPTIIPPVPEENDNGTEREAPSPVPPHREEIVENLLQYEINQNVNRALPETVVTYAAEPASDTETSTSRRSSLSSCSTDSLIPVRDVDSAPKSESVVDLSPLTIEEKAPVPPLISERPPQDFSAIDKLVQCQIRLQEEDVRKKRVRFNINRDKFKLVAAPEYVQPQQNDDSRKNTKVIPLPSYEITEDILMPEQTCRVCYLISPSDFYVQTDPKLVDMVTSSLNEEINSKTFFVKTKYTSKEDAKNTVGDFCVAYINQKASYFRVIVIDWMFENVEDEEIVAVELVDFGEKFYCEYHYLRRLTEVFATVPALSFPCHLAYIEPLKSDNGVWPKATTDFLCELINNQDLEVVFASKERSVYSVDLCLKNCEDSISEILIKKNLALQETSITLDAIDEQSDEDPVELDTIEEALLGYDQQDVARICPFTNSSGGCFKGARCKLDHEKLSEDGITTDKIQTFTKAFNELPLPEVHECIKIYVTAYVTCCCFYIHIIKDKSDNEPYNQNFDNLMNAMQSKENVQLYEKLKIYPSVGEIVLVKYSDGKWCRAKCVNLDETSVELFIVDFGFKYNCPLSELYRIKEELLHVPFQAIQCVLYNAVPDPEVDESAVIDFCLEHIVFKEFCASVECNNRPLSLGIYNESDYLDLGNILQQFGYAEAKFNDHKTSRDCFLQLE